MGVRGVPRVPGMNDAYNQRMIGGAWGYMEGARMAGQPNQVGSANEEGKNGTVENDCASGNVKDMGEETDKTERNVTFNDNVMSVTIPGGNEEVSGSMADKGRKEEREERRQSATVTATVADGGGNTTPRLNTGTISETEGEIPATTNQQQEQAQSRLANSSLQNTSSLQDTANNDKVSNTQNQATEAIEATEECIDLASQELASSVSLANNATQVASGVQLGEETTSNSVDRQMVGEEQRGLSQSDFSQPTPLPTDFSAREENGGKGKGRDSMAKSGTARLSLSGKGELAKVVGGKLVSLRVEGKSGGGEKHEKQGKGQKKEAMKLRSQSGRR